QLAAKLLPLERDLATEQQKKKTADEAVAGLDANKSAADTTWQATQGKTQELKQMVAKLGDQLGAQTKRLDELTRQANDLRARAADQFSKAAQNSAQAASDAAKLAQQLGTWSNNFPTSPEKKAWEQLRATYNTNIFKLAEAQADNALGNLHARHANQLEARQHLAAGVADIMQKAALTAPATLGVAAVDAEHKKAADAANKAYTDAAQKFQDVYQVGTTPKDVKDIAQISRMYSLYAQYLNGDKAAIGEAKKVYQEAFSDRKDDPFARSVPAEIRGEAPKKG
ncbi:MAG TPA: hypothetical protein VH475_17620, partial [Tepidisphaeraceae bacterium]